MLPDTERAFPIKQKFCLGHLLKRRNQHLALTMTAPMKRMMARTKKKIRSLSLKNPTEKIEWNEDMNMYQTQPFWYQCIPLFWCCLMLISNHLANVLQQYSLVYSELYQTSKMKPFTRKVTKKNSTPIKNIWLFYDFRDRGKKGLQRLINLLTIASC